MQLVTENLVETDFDIRLETQLYRASKEYALSAGGERTKAFVASLPELPQFKHWSIDVRVSMLMEGMYPCIPGWHCDDFYRPTGNQPDLIQLPFFAPSQHFMLVEGDCSLTEFCFPNLNFQSIYARISKTGENFYSVCDELISDMELKGITVSANNVYAFSPLDFHRGTKATKNGWRYFIRATASNHRVSKNEVRTQTQVYLDSANQGW